MSQLLENTYNAYNQFMEGELNEYDLMSLIENEIISEELLESMLEEGFLNKMYNNFLFHRFDLNNEIKKDYKSKKLYYNNPPIDSDDLKRRKMERNRIAQFIKIGRRAGINREELKTTDGFKNYYGRNNNELYQNHANYLLNRSKI